MTNFLKRTLLGGVLAIRGRYLTRDVHSAIADPTRRQVLDLLAKAGELPLHAMAIKFPMGRTGVSKHLAILKEAALVADHKIGRESRYSLNASGLRDVQKWVAYYERFWTQQIDRLKDLLEEDDLWVKLLCWTTRLRALLNACGRL